MPTAAILRTLNAPLSVEPITLPPLQRGQVLVQVAYSGLCRSQLMEVQGGRGEDKWLPHLLGHEGSGTVLEIGEGVTRVAPGDTVIMGWVRGGGINAPGAVYRDTNGARVNSGAVTTFSTHTIVAENRVSKLPDGIPLDVAVLFGCALPTGAGMVLNELKPAPGSRVAVIGLGGVGMSALLALSQFACAEIIAIDPSPEKLALAVEFGATHTINPTHTDVLRDVLARVPGGVDACVEAGGSVASIELGFALIRTGGGQLLFASHPPEGEMIRLAPHALISGNRIAGSWGGAYDPDRDHAILAGLYRAGKLPLEKLLSTAYPLAQVNEALAHLATGTALRPLLKMG